jgi:hypothetical protein
MREAGMSAVCEAPIRVVCAWCQREKRLAGLVDEDYQNDRISHGICDEHAVLVLAEARRAISGADATERVAS